MECYRKMRKFHLFLFVCLFGAFLLLTSIKDFQPVPQLHSEKKFPTFESKVMDDLDKRLKIAIWLNPTLSKSNMKYRREFVMEKMIIPQNTGNECFKDEQKCEMTIDTDEKTLKEADAIIFIEFARYFNMKNLPPNWEKWRRPEQIWAIQIDESPIKHPSTILEVFNWTLSYRRDSDIWLPYGKTVSKGVLNLNSEIMVGLNNDITLSKWIEGKSKLVTGVISNCHTNSKRELVLDKMIKTNKSVDIYGGCGNVKNVTEKCGFYFGECTNYWNNLARRYKFYLAFENSLCVDYATEKFWRTLRLGMVPVVYGGGDYGKLAPKGSFIDVSWFRSGEEMMGCLERVGGNEEEYARFFEWRRYFDVREEATRYMTKETDVWCRFCKKLRDLKNGEGEIEFKTVSGDWWSRMPNSSEKPCKSYKSFLKWK